MEMENIPETQSQTIKSICDILEAFGLPNTAVSKVRKKCWKLADSQSENKGNENGKEIH